MPEEPKVTIGNVCFIINECNSKILLLKRNRSPMKGMYTGVGGKTKHNEDIRLSCLREVKEETDIDLDDIQLKAIIKTVLADQESSSWILFVYVGYTQKSDFKICNEGDLEWVNESQLASYNLIGFIREIFPYVLKSEQLLEGTIYHDSNGNVIDKTMNTLPVHKTTLLNLTKI